MVLYREAWRLLWDFTTQGDMFREIHCKAERSQLQMKSWMCSSEATLLVITLAQPCGPTPTFDGDFENGLACTIMGLGHSGTIGHNQPPRA